jgi:hypothetical protein
MDLLVIPILLMVLYIFFGLVLLYILWLVIRALQFGRLRLFEIVITGQPNVRFCYNSHSWNPLICYLSAG